MIILIENEIIKMGRSGYKNKPTNHSCTINKHTHVMLISRLTNKLKVEGGGGGKGGRGGAEGEWDDNVRKTREEQQGS